MTGPTTAVGQDARRLKLDTLVRLRWLAVMGQCLAVTVVHFGLGYRLPFGLCIALIGAAALINLWLRVRRPASYRLSPDVATSLLAFDVIQLAGLLYLTGGIQNPFAILFLAPVLISATALPPERTVGLGVLAVGCATVLVLAHHKLPWVEGHTLELPFAYVLGIWSAILLGIVFTGAFAYRVSEEARQLSRALAATELVLAREQHLSQLDGLAAAAAHELGTPLATIALVARELDNDMPAGSPAKEDLRLLREQVERCRDILAKLTSLHDDEGGGFLETITVSHLVEDLVMPQRSFELEIGVDCAGEGPEPFCRRSPGLLYGLGNLVDNGVDFAAARLDIAARWSPDQVSIEIRDDGPGFAPDILLRVGEPYVTTRGREGAAAGGDGEVGSGLGLGLFIAKTLIERSGGQLVLLNAEPPSSGARARIVWPRPLFEAGTEAITKTSSARDLSESEFVPISST
ncbi:MAG: ActS/PrrB/RegB family redox-sensitive histidine kinase [Methylobacteriaceae bacterium]|nr:ActS/PrrB/RegB family redox-sensitive histidine kinase [Methylobacteriaceae bacterium]